MRLTLVAQDPVSGSSTLLEVARGLSNALKAGWKPARTIVLCSWDGEEFGLFGSTFFGENASADLTQNAIAYLNVDGKLPRNQHSRSLCV